jgi:ATP-dependent Clp protease adaptor protein ClpS
VKYYTIPVGASSSLLSSASRSGFAERRGSFLHELDMFEDKSETAVAEPVVRTGPKKPKPKRQPRYHVILWNDDDHSFEYVVRMMKELFAHPVPKGLQIAMEVHVSGKAICLTTTMEHAELKRDQIKAYGRDKTIARCKGSMSASIEPAPE